MKILQVNCVYNKGSTGKIMYDIHTYLQKLGHSSIVCYGRGNKSYDKDVYKTCGELYSKFNNLLSRFTGIMYGGCFFSTNKLIDIIKREKPDIVHLHCINGYFVNVYRIIKWLNNNNVSTVLTLHAEFMYTANCAYALDCERWKTGCGNCPRLRKETNSLFFDRTHRSWTEMMQSFKGFNNLAVVSVSPWLMDRAKQSPILRDKKHITVLNGIDTEIFKLYYEKNIKKELGIKNEKIVFHATPKFSNNPDHIKGGYYILELAKKMKNIKFVVAGNYTDDFSAPDNVILLGNISSKEKLAELYSMSDLTVIASRKETFSMIVAESLCCGTPVAGFKAGAPEQIAIPEYSRFVDYGNIEALENIITELLTTSFNKKDIADAAQKQYARERMAADYMNIYKKQRE